MQQSAICNSYSAILKSPMSIRCVLESFLHVQMFGAVVHQLICALVMSSFKAEQGVVLTPFLSWAQLILVAAKEIMSSMAKGVDIVAVKVATKSGTILGPVLAGIRSPTKDGQSKSTLGQLEHRLSYLFQPING
jgi:hypothetical protein